MVYEWASVCFFRYKVISKIMGEWPDKLTKVIDNFYKNNWDCFVLKLGKKSRVGPKVGESLGQQKTELLFFLLNQYFFDWYTLLKVLLN